MTRKRPAGGQERRTFRQAAFATLHNLYSRNLYRTVLLITKNREDAENAVQDSFIRAFVSISSFEGRSSFYSWLTRIGVNSALMILRRRRNQAEVSFELPRESFAQLTVRAQYGSGCNASSLRTFGLRKEFPS